MSDRFALTAQPRRCLQPVVNLLDVLTACEVVPSSITVEWPHTDRAHPYLHVWLRTRTDIETVAHRLGMRVEGPTYTTAQVGQRRYYTRGEGAGVLLEAISFPHHDDWETQ